MQLSSTHATHFPLTDADDVAEKIMRGLTQQALVDVLVDSVEDKGGMHAQTILGAGGHEHVELFSAIEPGSPFTEGGRDLAFECGDIIIIGTEENSSACTMQ